MFLALPVGRRLETVDATTKRTKALFHNMQTRLPIPVWQHIYFYFISLLPLWSILVSNTCILSRSKNPKRIQGTWNFSHLFRVLVAVVKLPFVTQGGWMLPTQQRAPSVPAQWVGEGRLCRWTRCRARVGLGMLGISLKHPVLHSWVLHADLGFTVSQKRRVVTILLTALYPWSLVN